MESDVRELAGFQELVDGHSKSRDELIRELAGEWIVRGEADQSEISASDKRRYRKCLRAAGGPVCVA